LSITNILLFARTKRFVVLTLRTQSYKSFFLNKISIIYDLVGRMHLQPNLMFVVRVRAYQSGALYEPLGKASILKKTSVQRPVL
jgi:hypothetical protein